LRRAPGAVRAEIPGYRSDIGHGASEAVKAVTRSFSGAVGVFRPLPECAALRRH